MQIFERPRRQQHELTEKRINTVFSTQKNESGCKQTESPPIQAQVVETPYKKLSHNLRQHMTADKYTSHNVSPVEDISCHNIHITNMHTCILTINAWMKNTRTESRQIESQRKPSE